MGKLLNLLVKALEEQSLEISSSVKFLMTMNEYTMNVKSAGHTPPYISHSLYVSVYRCYLCVCVSLYVRVCAYINNMCVGKCS